MLVSDLNRNGVIILEDGTLNNITWHNVKVYRNVIKNKEDFDFFTQQLHKLFIRQMPCQKFTFIENLIEK